MHGFFFHVDDFFPLEKIILLFIWGGICGFMIYIYIYMSGMKSQLSVNYLHAPEEDP